MYLSDFNAQIFFLPAGWYFKHRDWLILRIMSLEWDINDATIPTNVNQFDPFQDWPDDHIRLVYPVTSEPGKIRFKKKSHMFPEIFHSYS